MAREFRNIYLGEILLGQWGKNLQNNFILIIIIIIIWIGRI